MGDQRTGGLIPDEVGVERRSCLCGAVDVTFEEEAAKGVSAEEVRKRWPRGRCVQCNAIIYASWAHYIAGDW